MNAISARLRDDPVLLRFADEVARLFPGRIEQVILYGSRARGDARPESDYDLAVVVRDAPADGYDPALGELARAFHGRFGAEVHAWLATPPELRKSTLFAHNVRRDGVDILHWHKLADATDASGPEQEMQQIVANLLRHARECLDAAEVNLRVNQPRIAGRKSYMAVFHAAQALIFAHTGGSPKTHGGVSSEFNKVVHRLTGFDPELLEFVNHAYDYKQRADYHKGEPITPDEAKSALDRAKRVVAAIETLLA